MSCFWQVHVELATRLPTMNLEGLAWVACPEQALVNWVATELATIIRNLGQFVLLIDQRLLLCSGFLHAGIDAPFIYLDLKKWVPFWLKGALSQGVFLCVWLFVRCVLIVGVLCRC